MFERYVGISPNRLQMFLSWVDRKTKGSHEIEGEAVRWVLNELSVVRNSILPQEEELRSILANSVALREREFQAYITESSEKGESPEVGPNVEVVPAAPDDPWLKKWA